MNVLRDNVIIKISNRSIIISLIYIYLNIYLISIFRAGIYASINLKKIQAYFWREIVSAITCASAMRCLRNRHQMYSCDIPGRDLVFREAKRMIEWLVKISWLEGYHRLSVFFTTPPSFLFSSSSPFFSYLVINFKQKVRSSADIQPNGNR